ncbi:hypothetical protein AN642_00490 [Epulopiscium sp. SCG-B10WGA-EpuloA2]|nr:hypothetical protein AN642_00490 [Epulopiscium sp. SCG-B10WGA-EpuloA2]
MGNFIGPILPIITLIFLGKWCRQTQYISPSAIGEIKKFLLNICMVCTLLNIVLFMEITSESILIIVISYIMLCLFLIAGKLCNLLPVLHHKFTPYVCSGTAFMLVGMALFSMIYGNDNLAIFSFIGVGHEIFIWTIYYIWFRIDTSGQKFDLSIVKNLLKSPFIITIILGTILNIFDVGYILQSNPIGQGILQSIGSLSSIASPFVLVCLGYGIVLDVKYIKESLKLVFARYFVALTIGYLFKFLVIDNKSNNQGISKCRLNTWILCKLYIPLERKSLPTSSFRLIK